MFGMRGEPSAEALAGSGPTVTYPAPPSTQSEPNAIASVAGGTASSAPKITSTPNVPETAQVAGIDISPGYATQATNLAAAEANGFRPASAESPIGEDLAEATNPSATPDLPTTGYAFGARAITPKTDDTPPTSYAIGNKSEIASATNPVSVPSTSGGAFAPPPMDSMTSATSASAPSSGGAGGFTLPTDSPSFSAITPPSPATDSVAATAPATITAPAASTTSMPGMTAVDPGSMGIAAKPSAGTESLGPAAAASPDFSTASASTGYTAPSSPPSVLPPSVDGAGPGVGYMPGSTGTASGYPSSDAEPTTSGSYYR